MGIIDNNYLLMQFPQTDFDLNLKSIQNPGIKNPLFTTYSKPLYKKNASAKLQLLKQNKEFMIDFKT